MKFLGHRVAAEGIASDPGKVDALRKLPMPTSVSQLRSLLRGLSDYRKLLPKMAAVTTTLYEPLKKGRGICVDAWTYPNSAGTVGVTVES